MNQHCSQHVCAAHCGELARGAGYVHNGAAKAKKNELPIYSALCKTKDGFDQLNSGATEVMRDLPEHIKSVRRSFSSGLNSVKQSLVSALPRKPRGDAASFPRPGSEGDSDSESQPRTEVDEAKARLFELLAESLGLDSRFDLSGAVIHVPMKSSQGDVGAKQPSKTRRSAIHRPAERATRENADQSGEDQRDERREEQRGSERSGHVADECGAALSAETELACANSVSNCAAAPSAARCGPGAGKTAVVNVCQQRAAARSEFASGGCVRCTTCNVSRGREHGRARENDPRADSCCSRDARCAGASGHYAPCTAGCSNARLGGDSCEGAQPPVAQRCCGGAPLNLRGKYAGAQQSAGCSGCCGELPPVAAQLGLGETVPVMSFYPLGSQCKVLFSSNKKLGSAWGRSARATKRCANGEVESAVVACHCEACNPMKSYTVCYKY